MLIDADAQASLTLSLGVKYPDELKYSLSSVMQKIMDDEPFNPTDGIIKHDTWTPAGMMYGYYNSNELIIKDSSYDDWYIGG